MLIAIPPLLVFISIFGSLFYLVGPVSIALTLFFCGLLISLLFGGVAVYRLNFVFSKLGMWLMAVYIILISMNLVLLIFYGPNFLHPSGGRFDGNSLERLYVLSLGFPWLELFFSRTKHIFVAYIISSIINAAILYFVGDLMRRGLFLYRKL